MYSSPHMYTKKLKHWEVMSGWYASTLSSLKGATMVVTISKEKECVTLINTFFTSGSEDQDEVVKVLIDVTEEVMRHQPGFISTSIHRSYDGSTVTNYAQWRSSEDWNAALQKSREHLQLLTKYT